MGFGLQSPIGSHCYVCSVVIPESGHAAHVSCLDAELLHKIPHDSISKEVTAVQYDPSSVATR
jgi:hypothetical protein